jgi:ANTAR domain/GAF domain
MSPVSDAESTRPPEDPVGELANSISQAARALFSNGSVTDTLQRVVDLSVSTLDACDYAGIFLLDGNVITTPVRSSEIVIELDAFQHQAGEGPCRDAVVRGGSSYAGDLAEDIRWPRFGPLAIAAGIRSVLAFPLGSNGTRGALNLYARYPQAFGVIDRANGQILATLSDLALAAAEAHESEEMKLENLEHALATRAMIGQATGILMERERITADQAFDILRRASQHLNVRLRDVAQGLVDTGERPDTGRTARPT